MIGGRTVPILGVSGLSTATVGVTVPATTNAGTYVLLACADGPNAVSEFSETDNCKASTTFLTVTTPDYVVSAVSNPPATAVRGTVFNIVETTKNNGAAATVASVNRYYLSLNSVVDAGDLLLPTTRSVPALANLAVSTGTRALTVPSTTLHGTYRVIVCADTTTVIAEAVESNNCKASTTTVVVQAPDLVESTLSNPPATRARSATFAITDTTKNNGNVATTVNTSVKYYLSLDTVVNAGDKVLSPTRTVAVLAAAATSNGTVTVTVPASTVVGSYYVIACADSGAAVVEDIETNNCRVSTTKIAVT